MSSANDQFKDRATSSEGLRRRVSVNTQFGSANFDGWIRGLIEELPFGDALDICCGTGNQLVIYAGRQGLSRLAGVDLSAESLQVARSRLAELPIPVEPELLEVPMEEIFTLPSLVDSGFDLISCFYGLYYAADVPRLLSDMVDHLNVGGNILVIGPYGPNNASLFGLLQRRFDLPELVMRSSTTFMEEEVVPVLDARLDMRIETFVNRIVYPGVDSVMDYWRATTFYSEQHDEAVLRDVEELFKETGELVVEKHVMAAIGHRT